MLVSLPLNVLPYLEQPLYPEEPRYWSLAFDASTLVSYFRMCWVVAATVADPLTRVLKHV